MDFISFCVGFAFAGLILGIPLTIFAVPFFNLRKMEKIAKERQTELDKSIVVEVDPNTKELLDKADKLLVEYEHRNTDRDKGI